MACVDLGTDPLELEARHVHCVYSQIAPHFSDTRYKPWPRVAQFLHQLPPRSLIADVGCGNGKYFSVACGHGYMIGCDMCSELVDIAAGRGHEVAIADCLNLPYRTNSFDAAISIAVVHHMSSQSRRLQAVRELARVVREGGRMLVYVWAMEQGKKRFSEQDVMVPWHLQPKYTSTHEQVVVRKSKKKSKKQQTSRKKDRKVGQTVTGDERCCGKGEEEEEEEEGGEWGLAGLSLHEAQEELAEIGTTTLPSTTSLSTGEQNTTSSAEEAHSQTRDGARSVSNAGSSCSEGIPTDHQTPRCDVSTRHVTSRNDHVISVEATPSLEAQGFRTFHRYYHVFQKGELSTLFNEVGGVIVEEEFYDHENWCVVARKVT